MRAPRRCWRGQGWGRCLLATQWRTFGFQAALELVLFPPNVDTSAMFERFPSGEFKQLFNLYLASEHRRKGRVPRARNRMNKALASTPRPPAFLLALDGLLMIGEDRLQEARDRFAECFETAKLGQNADDDYVAKYCHLWLAIYDEKLGYEEIRSAAEEKNAAWSNASRIVRTYLPRTSLESLEENCGHRQSSNAYGWRPSATLTSVVFHL
jgi:hypothetical protein